MWLIAAEYAFKAIGNEGLATLGVRGREGAVVVSQRKVPDRLYEPDSVRHVFSITRQIGAVATGSVADARALVARARQEASDFAYRYGHAIPIDLLGRRLANLAQLSTQEAAMRPLGVALTLIGPDAAGQHAQLLKCDPAGFYASAVAAAFGPKAVDMQNALEKALHAQAPGDGPRFLGHSLQDTIDLAVRTMAATLSIEFKATDLEVGVVACAPADAPDAGCFRVLAREEVERCLARLVERD